MGGKIEKSHGGAPPGPRGSAPASVRRFAPLFNFPTHREKKSRYQQKSPRYQANPRYQPKKRRYLYNRRSPQLNVIRAIYDRRRAIFPISIEVCDTPNLLQQSAMLIAN